MEKLLIGLALSLPLQAFTIKVDYRYDTSGFFDAPGAKEALEAAAARWSRIIDQELLEVDAQDDARTDIRFQIIHPGTGERLQLSVAASEDSDVIAEFGGGAADIYLDGFTLEKDVWILYPGARPMTDEIGAAATIQLGAINVSSVPEDPDSPVNRGFNSGQDSLSVLGGTVSFDSNSTWNFSLFEPSIGNGIDFYSVALHEIGHGLGLSSRNSPEWRELSESGSYVGEFAVGAFNSDNGASINALEIESLDGGDFHWRNNTYQSFVFQLGGPNSFGVQSANVLQDLLMEPGLSFSAATPRFEVTNVEIGGLRDVGWSIIEADPPAPPIVILGLERSAEGATKISIPSEEGKTYTIQTSTNGQNWLSVTPSLIGDGEVLCWEDGQEGFTDPYGSAAELESKFYRVIEN